MGALRSFVILGTLVSPALSTAVPLTRPRAVAGQGWSLQSGTCPADTKSCGNESCCPSTSNCQATGNGEVEACCPTSKRVFWVASTSTHTDHALQHLASNCRGSVEGAPSCASAAWSLWTGSFGNGFCCEVGLTGAFVNGGSVAGICVTSVPSGYSMASLVRSRILTVRKNRLMSVIFRLAKERELRLLLPLQRRQLHHLPRRRLKQVLQSRLLLDQHQLQCRERCKKPFSFFFLRVVIKVIVSV